MAEFVLIPTPTLAVHNVHRRRISADIDTVGEMLERVGTADDVLWPVPESIPIEITAPLRIGSSGGHGPASYQVVGYQPRRWVRFELSRPRFMAGFHEFSVQPASDGTVILQHLLAVRLSPGGWLLYPLGLKSLHDQVIEKLLDKAELVTAGIIRGKPTRFTLGVRVRLTAMRWYRSLMRLRGSR